MADHIEKVVVALHALHDALRAAGIDDGLEAILIRDHRDLRMLVPKRELIGFGSHEVTTIGGIKVLAADRFIVARRP